MANKNWARRRYSVGVIPQDYCGQHVGIIKKIGSESEEVLMESMVEELQWAYEQGFQAQKAVHK